MPTVINSYLQDGAKSWRLTLISEFENKGKCLPSPRQLRVPFSFQRKNIKLKKKNAEINMVSLTFFTRGLNADIKLLFVARGYQTIP